MTSTVQPSPPRRIARTDAIRLREPIQGLFRLAKIQGRQADLFVGPRLAGIFHDDRFGCGNGVVESTLRTPQRGIRLQSHKVPGLDRERVIEQPLRLPKPLVALRFVVAVEEFEDERRGHPCEAVGAGRLNLERLLE
jgi:hypothetical protein